jgi:hypothetical protein
MKRSSHSWMMREEELSFLDDTIVRSIISGMGRKID